MMNPEMMKAATDMMSKMSPEEMNQMMEMTKKMDPSMMAQAQAMMNNPAMAAQAQQAMQNLSPQELKSRMAGASAAMGGAPAAPKPKSAVEQLKGSSMVIDEEVLSHVERAEALKLKGNTHFKAAEYEAAIGEYEQGCALAEEAIRELSGVDEKARPHRPAARDRAPPRCFRGLARGTCRGAVIELLHACHLNTASCRLKLRQWGEAVEAANTVLRDGPHRKALFRRGQAYQQLARLDEARTDLKKAQRRRPAPAAAMDRSDATVAAALAEVEKALGVEPSPPPAAPPAAAAAARPPPGGVPTKPDGSPDYAQMEATGRRRGAEMMQNMDPAQLAAMNPQFAGMDPAQAREPSLLSGRSHSPPFGAAEAPPRPLSPSATSPADQGDANMSPEMMQAGMDMVANMDPAALADMAKMMGMDAGQASKLQDTMANMSKEDLAKWTGRAQTVARWTAKPLALYRKVSSLVPPTYLLAG
ncbi:hypothetical protein EMIHUDRAFT_470443 [Emiliania huxleyi CCMP1516]|uniref:STI1 domain-containing protein n=2 Tax=Emiliania huxleyi TaxID=2903 RepID=A0A0D3IY84_EMIH1|nr:hypothetical protein EMIHUDRAFT_470443 [Emiliania huxleyi CCMP1516]EOD16219.1 hypothetical protein EMIHUDRAFT_470443 [Emiliania huxleyi CCMP1516]|eukprot:XP_005768648.1 hypothetical protein EMIHUDRAFT_470443 [Emiliania huxleyi CCMP1516]